MGRVELKNGLWFPCNVKARHVASSACTLWVGLAFPQMTLVGEHAQDQRSLCVCIAEAGQRLEPLSFGKTETASDKSGKTTRLRPAALPPPKHIYFSQLLLCARAIRLCVKGHRRAIHLQVVRTGSSSPACISHRRGIRSVSLPGERTVEGTRRSFRVQQRSQAGDSRISPYQFRVIG